MIVSAITALSKSEKFGDVSSKVISGEDCSSTVFSWKSEVESKLSKLSISGISELISVSSDPKSGRSKSPELSPISVDSSNTLVSGISFEVVISSSKSPSPPKGSSEAAVSSVMSERSGGSTGSLTKSRGFAPGRLASIGWLSMSGISLMSPTIESKSSSEFSSEITSADCSTGSSWGRSNSVSSNDIVESAGVSSAFGLFSRVMSSNEKSSSLETGAIISSSVDLSAKLSKLFSSSIESELDSSAKNEFESSATGTSIVFWSKSGNSSSRLRSSSCTGSSKDCSGPSTIERVSPDESMSRKVGSPVRSAIVWESRVTFDVLDAPVSGSFTSALSLLF